MEMEGKDVEVRPLEVAVSRFKEILESKKPSKGLKTMRNAIKLKGHLEGTADLIVYSVPYGVLSDEHTGTFCTATRATTYEQRLENRFGIGTTFLQTPMIEGDADEVEKYARPNKFVISRGINSILDPTQCPKGAWVRNFVHVNDWSLYLNSVEVEFSRFEPTRIPAEYVVCTPKLDGESVQVSGVSVGGRGYWVVGWSEAHLMARNEMDLEKYEGRQRFERAVQIARKWFAFVRERSHDAHRMLEFMRKYQLTANFVWQEPTRCKYADHSRLESPRFVFITWSSRKEMDDRFHTFDPRSSTAVAKGFGLETVECKVISLGSLQKYWEDIIIQHHKLGEVLYFIGNDQILTGLLKITTLWYQILKVIRKDTIAVLRLTRRKYQIGERQIARTTPYIDADDECESRWNELRNAFVLWSLDLEQTGEDLVEGLAERFMQYWQRFLRETSMSDEVVLSKTERSYPFTDELRRFFV